MKRTVILLLALLLALSLWGCAKKPEPSPSPAPTYDPGSRGETVTTAPPGEDPASKPLSTPEPAETFRPAPEPTPDVTPEPTPEPETTPEPQYVDPAVLASGSFRSDTGTALNLVADWKIVTLTETACRVTVTLYLESYSLDVGERRGNLLTFNDEDYYFITDPIEIGDGFSKTQIFVWSKEIPVSDQSFTLSVRWNLQGSYSKKQMESIEVSGSYEHEP